MRVPQYVPGDLRIAATIEQIGRIAHGQPADKQTLRMQLLHMVKRAVGIKIHYESQTPAQFQISTSRPNLAEV